MTEEQKLKIKKKHNKKSQSPKSPTKVNQTLVLYVLPVQDPRLAQPRLLEGGTGR